MYLGHVVVQSRPLSLLDGDAVRFGASIPAARRQLGLNASLRVAFGSRRTCHDARGFEMLADLFSLPLPRP